MDRSSSQSELLTPREEEIAKAFSGEESYSQIADRLCIAPSTVRAHLNTVYRKLGVSSKLQLHKYFENEAKKSSGPGRKTSTTDKPSIAVLAFENMSGDPEQEYFSDGITEDIITALSRSPWLFVIARNTSFTYKGESVDVKRVAEDLGVRYVVEGSVRRAGDRIRVTAQLIDGLTGGHIWSERYDGQLADVFDLQDEITRNVVASVLTKVHLTASDAIEKRSRPDLTVWELTMRGWHLLYDFSPESFAAAEEVLHQALEHDANSAEANLVLSVIAYHQVILGFAAEPEKTADKAYELGRKATRLDHQNEYAHWAFGLSCFCQNRHDEAIRALERAVELNPNCSVAYGSLGTALGLVGRVEEAIDCQQIAIRSNPRDPSIFFRYSGMALANHLAGRHDLAVDWASKAVHIMPQWYLGHFVLAAAHHKAGRIQEAQAAIESCYRALPEASVADLDRMPLQRDDHMQSLRTSLRAAGLRD